MRYYIITTCILLLLLLSCQRETSIQTCYEFENTTDFDIAIEIYGSSRDQNGNRIVKEVIGSHSQGLFFLDV